MPSDPAARGLILLRHAWAGDRDTYPGADHERPLDRRGREQAERLPGHLQRHLTPHLGSTSARLAIVSSPFTRCVQTVEPLARSLGVGLTVDERLAEIEPAVPSQDGWPDAAWLGARALAAIDDLVDPDGPLVVCSHGEVLPALLASVAGFTGRVVPSTLDLDAKALPKSGAWVVPPAPGGIVQLAAPDAG